LPQIVTLTLNPALDVLTSLARVEPIHKLRCDHVTIHPGGGGINVARVLTRLGADHLAVYLSGGLTGQEHEQLLRAQHVPVSTVRIAQETRESFSVHEHQSGQDYRFVLPGPTVTPSEVQQLILLLQAHWPSHMLVVSGGNAPGVADDLYAQLAQMCHERGTRMVLDSNAQALRMGLSAGVYLVKPSQRELESLVGYPLTTDAQILAASRVLIESAQAQIVAVSMGERGAMWVERTDAWVAKALPIEVKTTIGAGDSFVGAAVWALSQGEASPRAFAYAMAGGAAALLNPGTSLCEKADVLRLVDQVQVRAIGVNRY
jgi:6-phosphofructokinase 2